jgi:hypothetical protein
MSLSSVLVIWMFLLGMKPYRYSLKCKLMVSRYDTLSITGTDVNIRYDKDSGEFKFSGTYGRSGL